MRKIDDRISTQLRINETLYKKVKEIAYRENRYTNSQMEYFIRLGVDRYEAEHGPIQVSASESGS